MPVHRVVLLDDLPDSRPVRYVVDGRPVCLTKVDGVPHAICDTCPHNGASLAEGVVRDGHVTCPAHLWRFDLASGRKPGTSAVAVAVYRTHVSEEGWVEVELPEPPPVRSLRETLLAHARGEALQ